MCGLFNVSVCACVDFVIRGCVYVWVLICVGACMCICQTDTAVWKQTVVSV